LGIIQQPSALSFIGEFQIKKPPMLQHSGTPFSDPEESSDLPQKENELAEVSRTDWGRQEEEKVA